MIQLKPNVSVLTAIMEGTSMSNESILPEGENLRRAIRWISDKGSHSLQVIDEASIRFDLSPADASFLVRHFSQKTDA
jgi:hypothetical protein